MNGKAVTVKQPLPLPQGVSDLAVGNGNRMYKAAAMPTLAADDSRALREMAPVKVWQGSSQSEVDREKGEKKGISEKIQVELRKIEVSEGLSEAYVKEMIERAMPAIQNCDRSGAGDKSIPIGEVVFNLVIGPEGNVLKVYMEKGRTAYDDFEKCTIKSLKKLRFSGKMGRKEVDVRIVLILR